MSVEEANRARELARRQTALGVYFVNVNDDFVQVSLEPLDVEGNTVRDPQLLDDDLNVLPTIYSDDFPYRRPDL